MKRIAVLLFVLLCIGAPALADSPASDSRQLLHNGSVALIIPAGFREIDTPNGRRFFSKDDSVFIMFDLVVESEYPLYTNGAELADVLNSYMNPLDPESFTVSLCKAGKCAAIRADAVLWSDDIQDNYYFIEIIVVNRYDVSVYAFVSTDPDGATSCFSETYIYATESPL